MDNTIWLLVVFLVSLRFGSAVSDTCADIDLRCKCEMYSSSSSSQVKYKVNCSGSDLTDIPNLPTRTAILDFSNNRLRPESLGKLCRYGYLLHVNLSRNHLTAIPDTLLQRCFITDSLSLSGNIFDVISMASLKGLEVTHAIYGLSARYFTDNAFSLMSKLSDLEITIHQLNISEELLSGTALKRLKIEIAQGPVLPSKILEPLVKSLQELIIVSHTANSLPTTILHRLETLHTIEFRMPELRFLPHDLFQSYALYKTVLEVSVQMVRSLPRAVFNNLNSLRHLKINSADDLPSRLFSHLYFLESLDLSKCHVTTIPSGLFLDLRNLRFLSVKQTGLISLSQSDLDGMTTLIHIDISHNGIRELARYLFFGISASTEVINISHNRIKVIPANLFAERAAVRVLHLHDNNIYSIENGAFDNLDALEEVYLQNNKLYKLSQEMLLRNSKLRIVNIASNILITLTEGLLNSNKELTKLNLADNRLHSLLKSINICIPTLLELIVDFNPLECNCDVFIVRAFLQNAEIIGDCEINGTLVRIQTYLENETGCVLSHSDFRSNVSGCKSLKKSKSDIVSETLITISSNEFIHRTLLPASLEQHLSTIASAEQNNSTANYADDLKASFSVEWNYNKGDSSSGLKNTSEMDSVYRGTNFFLIPNTTFTFSDVSNNVNITQRREAEMQKPEREVQESYFYLALTLLILVTLVCALILCYVYKKRRQSNIYEVSSSGDIDIGRFFNEARSETETTLPPLKEVPSIQVESVDDEGNVDVQLYNADKT